MDFSGIDLDSPNPHMIEIAIEEAKKGDTNAARKLLQVFTYGLRGGHVDGPLLDYVASALEAIVKGADPNKALRLKRSQRGRPKTNAAEIKHLCLAVAVHRKMNPSDGARMTLEDAASEVAQERKVAPRTAQNAYCESTELDRRGQIAFEEQEKLWRKENSSN